MKLYQDRILEHYHSPRHHGVLEKADAFSTIVNRSCGDKVTIYIQCNDTTVICMQHVGEGCVISRAAASLLSEWAQNKSFHDIEQATEHVILDLLKIELGPVRIKCALLPLEALIQAVKDYKTSRS